MKAMNPGMVLGLDANERSKVLRIGPYFWLCANSLSQLFFFLKQKESCSPFKKGGALYQCGSQRCGSLIVGAE